jgi:multidrug efflux system membrane fusion protein
MNEAQDTHGTASQVVKVAQAISGDMPETLTELGTVSPIATVTVQPELSGYLTQVGYREGEDVTKGQFWPRRLCWPTSKARSACSRVASSTRCP